MTWVEELLLKSCTHPGKYGMRYITNVARREVGRKLPDTVRMPPSEFRAYGTKQGLTEFRDSGLVASGDSLYQIGPTRDRKQRPLDSWGLKFALSEKGVEVLTRLLLEFNKQAVAHVPKRLEQMLVRYFEARALRRDESPLVAFIR